MKDTDNNFYRHIISLGFFCSPALELNRHKLRDTASPFDWVISEWKGVEHCIKTHFEGFLEYEDLKQWTRNRAVYKNSLGIEFWHDFHKNIPLKKDFFLVKSKYNRRINRFYKNIQEPALFVRYIKDEIELNYFLHEYNNILNDLKKYNYQNGLIFVANTELNNRCIYPFPVFWVKSDENDIVARKFLDKNIFLKEFLIRNTQVSNSKRKKINIAFKVIRHFRLKWYSSKGENHHTKEY